MQATILNLLLDAWCVIIQKGNAQRSRRTRALPVPAFVDFAAALRLRRCVEHLLHAREELLAEFLQRLIHELLHLCHQIVINSLKGARCQRLARTRTGRSPVGTAEDKSVRCDAGRPRRGHSVSRRSLKAAYRTSSHACARAGRCWKRRRWRQRECLPGQRGIDGRRRRDFRRSSPACVGAGRL